MDKETNDTNKQDISNRLFRRNLLEHSYISSNQNLNKDLSRLGIMETKNKDVAENYSNNYYIENQCNNLTSSSIINQINQNSNNQNRINKPEQNTADIFNERLSKFTPIAKTNTFPFVDNVFYNNKAS